jgi:hypothetical protein
MVWYWEQSNHGTEWIRRGNRDGDGVDAERPMEMETR